MVQENEMVMESVGTLLNVKEMFNNGNSIITLNGKYTMDKDTLNEITSQIKEDELGDFEVSIDDDNFLDDSKDIMDFDIFDDDNMGKQVVLYTL